MNPKLRAMLLGATGQFPEGKLNKDDEGEIRFVVGHSPEGQVILDFGKEVKWLGMPPEGARQLAAILLLHADEVEKKKN